MRGLEAENLSGAVQRRVELRNRLRLRPHWRCPKRGDTDGTAPCDNSNSLLAAAGPRPSVGLTLGLTEYTTFGIVKCAVQCPGAGACTPFST